MATTVSSKNTLNFIKLLLLVLLIIVAAIGGTFFLLKQYGGMLLGAAPQATQPAPVEPPVVAKPIFVALEPFTVTVNEGVTRVLYAEISVRVLDSASSDQIRTYMPEVRNRILSELTKQRGASVQTSEGRSQLAQDIAAALRLPYDPQLPAAKISSVLFTAFVVQ